MKELGAGATADDVLHGVELTGARVLVTGVGSGLGLETARSAAAHGADVVGTARDPVRARARLAVVGAPGIDVVPCDLASLADVRACARALSGPGEPFDVVAPAGEVAGRYCEDCHVAEVADRGNDGVRPYGVDPERAALLWAASEALVGERFP